MQTPTLSLRDIGRYLDGSHATCNLTMLNPLCLWPRTPFLTAFLAAAASPIPIPTTTTITTTTTTTAPQRTQAQAQQACYRVNGKLWDSSSAANGISPPKVCNPDAAASHCCSSGDLCLDNGLCLDFGWDRLLTAQGCTDRSWPGHACVLAPGRRRRPPSSLPNVLTLYMCAVSGPNDALYCAADGGDGPKCCFDGSERFQVPNFKTIVSAADPESRISVGGGGGSGGGRGGVGGGRGGLSESDRIAIGVGIALPMGGIIVTLAQWLLPGIKIRWKKSWLKRRRRGPGEGSSGGPPAGSGDERARGISPEQPAASGISDGGQDGEPYTDLPGMSYSDHMEFEDGWRDPAVLEQNG